ncbi:MAG TPA: aminoacyl-tRNA hydrolase, partial [Pseudomonadales bacterium]
QYANTRHNAGAWLLEKVADQAKKTLVKDSKFHGLTSRINISGQDVHLLIPTTFMNLSGQAVTAMARFYKIPADAILIVHDELDLPPGTARFKTGGGHGGHNGLRDIISCMGNEKNFHRLRIGVGHPGDSKNVANYLTEKKPSAKERTLIDTAIDEAISVLPKIVSGDTAAAMNRLHSFQAN